MIAARGAFSQAAPAIARAKIPRQLAKMEAGRVGWHAISQLAERITGKNRMAAAAQTKPQPKPPAGKQASKQAGKQASPPAVVTRGLSVNQPWAWALLAGPSPGIAWKPVENRTWETNYRGPVVIQAGSSKRCIDSDYVLETIFGADPDAMFAAWNDDRISWGNKQKSDDNQLLYFGAILGVVDLVGCIEYRPERGDDFDKLCVAAGLQWWLDKNKAHQPAEYWAEAGFCWLFDSPRQFTQPIPAKGRLSLYGLTPEEISAVARSLRAPLGSPVEYRAKLAAGKAAAGKKQPATAGKK